MLGQLDNNDHCEISFILRGVKDFRSVNKHRVPDFRKANYKGLRRHLEEISWSPLEGKGDVRSGSEGEETGEGRSDQVCTGGGVSEVKAEKAYTFFLDNLIACQKQNIPYRAIRSLKNDPKWMTIEN